MERKHFAFAAVAVLIWSIPSASFAATASRARLRGVVIRPQFGMAVMNPRALNYELQSTFNYNSAMRVTSGAGLAVSADYPVLAERLYVGARVDYFSASSDTITIGGGNPGTARASVSGLPFLMTAAYKVPLAPKWSLIASVGGGLTLGYSTAVDVAGSNDAVNAPNGTLAYTSSPFTAMGSASLGYALTRKVALQLDAGYRLLSSNRMTATEKYGTVKEGQVLMDRQTATTEVLVDGSAFFSSLSVAITL